MSFLRNAWYAAGWSANIGSGSTTRIQILNEWIATLWRCCKTS